jgi:hypothetical protein
MASSVFSTLSQFFSGQDFKKALNNKTKTNMKFVSGTKNYMFCSGKGFKCPDQTVPDSGPEIRVETFTYSDYSFLKVRKPSLIFGLQRERLYTSF